MEEIPLWYWLIVFFGVGACVGSFYNVIVYRMPRGISLINPPSHCPLCKKRSGSDGVKPECRSLCKRLRE